MAAFLHLSFHMLLFQCSAATSLREVSSVFPPSKPGHTCENYLNKKNMVEGRMHGFWGKVVKGDTIPSDSSSQDLSLGSPEPPCRRSAYLEAAMLEVLWEIDTLRRTLLWHRCVQIPETWVRHLQSSIWSPDIIEQRWVISTMPCLSPWSTYSVNLIYIIVLSY